MAASAAHRAHCRSRRECAVHGGLDAGRSTPNRQFRCADQCHQSLAMGSRVPCCGSCELSSHRCGLRDAPPCCHLLGDLVCVVVREPSTGAVSSCCTDRRHSSGRRLMRGRLHRHAGTAQTRLRAPAVEACHDCHVWRIRDRARSRLPAGQPALRLEMASEVLRDRRPTGRELAQRPRCKHVLTRPAASHICMPGKDDHPWSPLTGSLATQPRVPRAERLIEAIRPVRSARGVSRVPRRAGSQRAPGDRSLVNTRAICTVAR